MYTSQERADYIQRTYDTAGLHARIEAIPERISLAREELAESRSRLRDRETELKDAEAMVRTMVSGPNKEARDAEFLRLVRDDVEAQAARLEVYETNRDVEAAERALDQLERELGVLHTRMRLIGCEIAAIFNA